MNEAQLYKEEILKFFEDLHAKSPGENPVLDDVCSSVAGLYPEINVSSGPVLLVCRGTGSCIRARGGLNVTARLTRSAEKLFFFMTDVRAVNPGQLPLFIQRAIIYFMAIKVLMDMGFSVRATTGYALGVGTGKLSSIYWTWAMPHFDPARFDVVSGTNRFELRSWDCALPRRQDHERASVRLAPHSTFEQRFMAAIRELCQDLRTDIAGLAYVLNAGQDSIQVVDGRRLDA